ncbi:MAG: hypothetical protein ABI678_23265 [Kofleriaceae bacterium]
MKSLFLLLLPGCAQLFGLDDTTGPTTDAPGPGAHVTIQHESIGATVVDAPADGTTVTFHVPDAAGGFQQVAATLVSRGVWDGDLPDGIHPMVDFQVDGVRHLWAFPTRDLHVVSALLEHPDPQPAPSPASLTLNVAVDVAGGESFTLYTVGAWSAQGLVNPGMAAALTQVVDYEMSTPIGGPLVKIIPADAVLILRRQLDIASGTYPLDGVFQTTVAQTGDDTLAGSLNTTAIDKMVTATVTPNALATRYTAVRPAVSGLAMGVAVVASPGFTRGNINGPTLNDRGIAMTDTSITLPYGNPFASLGWNELVYFNSYESRSVTVTGAMTAFSLDAGEQTFTTPSANLAFDLPAGLPETISLESTPLTTDNMTVALDPTKYAHVTMVNDRPSATFVSAQVLEVTVDAAGTPALKLVIEIAASDPAALVLPPNTLVVGHTYTIAAITHQGGFPNLATGDLATTAPPFHVAHNYSGVFTVESP